MGEDAATVGAGARAAVMPTAAAAALQLWAAYQRLIELGWVAPPDPPQRRECLAIVPGRQKPIRVSWIGGRDGERGFFVANGLQVTAILIGPIDA